MNDYKLVFFTDDDHDDMHIIQEIIDDLGHSCEIFYNGEELLTVINNLETRPDVIFLDINMPMIDGYELIKEIRSNSELNNIPIVMHTGLCDEACIKKCFELGADYFIAKAFRYGDMKNAIQHAINKDWTTHKPTRGNFVH